MNEAQSPVLRASHIAKKFSTENKEEQLEVLTDVNLTMQLSDVVAIVGSSGCGKSTLLHILGGLDRPNAGKIWWEDNAIHTLKTDQLAEMRNRHIGFVFQFHHLLPEFTAIENVMMPALIRGDSQEIAREKAAGLLDRFDMGNRLQHRPSQLSGGEQQRVSMARALMNDPAMILADEPTGNLDEKNTETILSLLFELREDRNLSIILVTHEQFIAERCDQIFLLQNGLLTKQD